MTTGAHGIRRASYELTAGGYGMTAGGYELTAGQYEVRRTCYGVRSAGHGARRTAGSTQPPAWYDESGLKMQDEWDEIEAAARSALEQQDPWLNLLSASQRATDSWHFWTCAFEGAVQRRNAALADQIMRERIQPHEDYSAQPWLTTDHALMLEQLGRVEEALGAIRSALGDLPFDKALQQVEWRLLAKQTSSSRKG